MEIEEWMEVKYDRLKRNALIFHDCFSRNFLPHKFAIFIVTEPNLSWCEGRERGKRRVEEVNKIKI
jgi:hypothetical protein